MEAILLSGYFDMYYLSTGVLLLYKPIFFSKLYGKVSFNILVIFQSPLKNYLLLTQKDGNNFYLLLISPHEKIHQNLKNHFSSRV